MARVGTKWYTRWGRYIFTISLIASIAGGAAIGVEARPDRPAALHAATAFGAVGIVTTQASPLPTTPAQVSGTFVVPQPRQFTPYGTPAKTPHMGEAARILLTEPAVQICDLLADTITRSVTVYDYADAPVAGVYVVFTVWRSDAPEPQLVGDTTSVSGEAFVTVAMPDAAPGSAVPTYHIDAVVETNAGPQQVNMEITNYTCAGSIAD